MTTASTKTARAVADLTEGVILASVEVAAAAERVFRALTDPKELARWWGSSEAYRADEWTADFRVGGRWRARGRNVDGRPFSVEGEFLEIEPPRKVVRAGSRIGMAAPPPPSPICWIPSRAARASPCDTRALVIAAIRARAMVKVGNGCSDGFRSTSPRASTSFAS